MLLLSNIPERRPPCHEVLPAPGNPIDRYVVIEHTLEFLCSHDAIASARTHTHHMQIKGVATRDWVRAVRTGYVAGVLCRLPLQLIQALCLDRSSNRVVHVSLGCWHIGSPYLTMRSRLGPACQPYRLKGRHHARENQAPRFCPYESLSMEVVFGVPFSRNSATVAKLG